MKLTDRVANAYNAFTKNDKAKNDIGNQAADFLRYGNRNKPMLQDWSQVEMSDQDMYTGYSYAAIKKRANRCAIIGRRFLFTEAADPIMEAAKAKDDVVMHPYLKLIEESKDFTQRRFWHDVSTYLDLEGVYYLMAVRAVAQNADGTPKIGAVQRFVMLNPYEVRRVVRDADGTLGGYIESHNGLYREIPKEMIIEIRLLNPFDNDLPYSMTDAAKESQFTLKQAGDYARHSIKGNINAPGAITTDVVLEDHIFDNFVSRIQSHHKGEPLYGNGAGAIKWESMQIDLDKAALDKINEIHRSVLFAVSGTSKTTLGIEESGTTRDTSQVQKDNFTEDAVMPQIEDIIDALNLDYRKYYPEWEKDKYEILLDNPLESDRDSELKDIEIRQTEHDMVVALVGMGYEYDIAAKYAQGEISLEELGEPTLEPQLTDQEVAAQAAAAAGLPPPTDGTTDPNADPNAVPDPNAPAGNAFTARDEKQKTKPLESRRLTAQNALTATKMVTPEENQKRLKAAIVEAKKEKKRLDSEAIKAEKAAQKPQEDGEPTVITKDTPQEEENLDELVDTETKTEKPPVLTVEIKTPNNVEDRLKAVNQIASRDYPDLYDGMGIDFDNLGCIMVNTTKIPVMQYIKDDPEADLFYETTYDQSAVPGENEAHVTLLFGLLENGNTWKDKVDQLLLDWKLPSVVINEVSYFDLGNSYAIVGLIDPTPALVDGHERLTLLPHVNTFSEYHPHITLAYINHDVDPQKWVKPLNKIYAGQKVATKGINYGDLPETNEPPVLDDNVDPEEPEATSTINNEAKLAILTPVEGSRSHVHNDNDTEPNSTYEKAKNALEPDTRDAVVLQESSLYKAVSEIERDMAQAVLLAIRNGDYKEAGDLLTQAQEKTFNKDLVRTLSAFFLILFPIYAKQLMASRANKFDKQGIFAMTDDVENYIADAAGKAADSHIATVLKDLEGAVVNAYNKATEEALIDLIQEGVQAQNPKLLKKLPLNPNKEDIVRAVKDGKWAGDNPLYKKAREVARQGKGLDSIAQAIKQEYTSISRNRARTIARHETNRVFNMAQYQADVQFLTESGLMPQAYKVLRNRANDPCPVCAQLIEESRANPIPFTKNFADLGETLTATYTKENGKTAVQTIPINYEAITAGNVHVNCRCEYELIIKNSDGSILNNIDCRVVNTLGYNGGSEDTNPKASNGGSGSGNWGHSGREGAVGGSGQGTLSKEERTKKIAEYKDLQGTIGKYLEIERRTGGLSASEAREFEKATKKQSDLMFELYKPLTEDKVFNPKEVMSTLKAPAVVAASNDKMSNKAVFDAIQQAAVGVYHDRDTPVDDIMNGKSKKISAQKFYDTFENTRTALKEQYGDKIPLYRATGLQKEKYTTNWATTEDFAKLFGANIVQKDVPIKNVIAVNVSNKGKYHEVIVGKPPKAENMLDKEENAKKGNPYHDKAGRFATGPGGHGGVLSDSATDKEVNDLATRYYPKGKAITATVKKGDPQLQKIYEDVKFNGLPVDVTKAEYSAATKAYPELVRGVPKAAYAHDFFSGETHRAGAGYYGSGTYFAMDKSQASAYGSNVFYAALSPKAKIVKFTALQKEMTAFTKKHKNSKAAKLLTSNPGRFAAMRGYDAIQVLDNNSFKPLQQVVVLNRGATVLPPGK